jgi:hypothetical protein
MPHVLNKLQVKIINSETIYSFRTARLRLVYSVKTTYQNCKRPNKIGSPLINIFTQIEPIVFLALQPIVVVFSQLGSGL